MSAQKQLPAATGEGYDPRGPRLWNAGQQYTHRELSRAAREAEQQQRDEQWFAEREMDQRAADLGILQPSDEREVEA